MHDDTLISFRDCAQDLSDLINQALEDHTSAMRKWKNEIISSRNRITGEVDERILNQDPDTFFLRIPADVYKLSTEMGDSNKVAWVFIHVSEQILRERPGYTEALVKSLGKKSDPGQKTLHNLNRDVGLFVHAFRKLAVSGLSVPDRVKASSVIKLLPRMEETLGYLNRLGGQWYREHCRRQRKAGYWL